MLETSETFTINAPIEAVWSYASDMRNWASNMPFFDSFQQLSDKESRWTLKPKLGPFTRTVRMLVTISEWQPPSHIAFTLHSETDPVEGNGSFDAQSLEPERTNVTLALRLDSHGPLAPMMEGLARPVLPRMARSFAQNLARDIERGEGAG
ncbi:MAG TPA: SRPBCC family protein [Thermomicrobiaceae bacterium]|nr:SRPBCC family protein [Thermomicrobiaceae bacterium]